MVTRWRSFTAQAINKRSYRIGFIVSLFVLYAVGYHVFYPQYANSLGSFFFGVFLVVPVIAAAWMLGLRAGFIAWLVSIPLQVVLLMLCGGAPVAVLVEEGGFWGYVLSLLALIPTGRFHDLKKQLGRQSETQKAEESLYQSRHFVHEVMEHIPDIVYIHDLETNSTVYSNHAITSALGYTPEAVRAMGSAVDDIILHPEDMVAISPDVRKKLEAARDGEVVSSEYRVRHADGQWRSFAAQEVVFLRSSSGTPKQLLGIAQDITERKKAIEAMREKARLEVTLEKERELAQLKNRLMNTLSHEFRTPLSIILASNELLERYHDHLTPTRRDECLATIKTQVMHLREMLDDISTLVGQGDTVPRFRPNPVDLAETIRQIVEGVQASIGSSYTISFQANGHLNPVDADGDLLRTILKNLLSNAVKYSHPGQTVYCNLAREGDEAVLTVRDEGIGIPKDEHSRIFDTFHRASNVLNIGGLGLGLRIVRDYVKLHGGSVHIDSEEGEGTTVTVRLPVVAKVEPKA